MHPFPAWLAAALAPKNRRGRPWTDADPCEARTVRRLSRTRRGPGEPDYRPFAKPCPKD